MATNTKINYILAHGAGAPSNSEWMEILTKTIKSRSKNQIEVHRFNFDYMERRLKENKKYPPDRMPKLLQKWQEVIKHHIGKKNLFIGGKSMGGRSASLLDFERFKEVKGIVNFGFPFHAPGKPPGDRINHLKELSVPCLINQGERDPMGNIEDIKSYELSGNISLNYLADGNHDLKPRVKSGKTLESNINEAVDEMIRFMMKVINKQSV